MSSLVARSFPAAAMLAAASAVTNPAPHAEAIGWRLGVQAFCFYRITFFDMIDHLETIGIRYVEAYPGHKLGGAWPDTLFNENMPPEARAVVKKRLADAHITLVNIGVINLPNDEAQCRKVFDFAKDMAIETLVSEPPTDAFPMIDKLCAEYKIDVAIHNHPEPSPYWYPEHELTAFEGRSNRIGSCVDTSHWMRSGVNVEEWLKKLEGRIKCFHFGDVNPEKLAEFNEAKKKLIAESNPPTMVQHITQVPNAVYGQGAGDMMAWLREIKRQNIRALFCVEAFFERPPDETTALIAECAKYFDAAAVELSKN